MCTRRFTSKNERGENALLLVQGHSESPETWEIASNPEYMTAPGVRIGAVEITGTAIDRFAELERRAGWVSVKDRLPEKGSICLVCGKNGGMRVARASYYEPLDLWTVVGTGKPFKVTHWQPLPAPPADAE